MGRHVGQSSCGSFTKVTVIVGAIWIMLLPVQVRADAFDQYKLLGSFELPLGADVFEVLNDGRLVVLMNADVFLEEGFRSRTFVSNSTLNT